jgi:hypothetical protein
MKFKKLVFQCECGRSTSHIREVGLTTEHELVFRRWCPACKRHIYAVKSLADCWRECQPEAVAEELSDSVEVTTSDAQFLRSVGILASGAEF